jgi:hypothetical protein
MLTAVIWNPDKFDNFRKTQRLEGESDYEWLLRDEKVANSSNSSEIEVNDEDQLISFLDAIETEVNIEMKYKIIDKK